MTNEQFCEIESQFSGEEMDKVEQVTYVNLSGREMKEFLEFAIEYREEAFQNPKFKTMFLTKKSTPMKSFYKALLWVALWFAMALIAG